MKITDNVRDALLRVGIDPDPHDTLLTRLRVSPGGTLRPLFSTSQYKMKLGEAAGVATKVLHLAPAADSGFNMCAFAGACAVVCCKTTGHMAVPQADLARVSRTLWWKLDPEGFLDQLDAELLGHVRRAANRGLHPAARPNGTSDELWERYGVPQRNPLVDFYDYTKVPLDRRRDLPANYTLTYSVSETPGSLDRALEYLAAGRNAAIVVQSKGGSSRRESDEELVRIVERGELLGYPVMNGDVNDLRFRDPKGTWVLLAAKGPGVRDTTGFVYRDAFTPARLRIVA